MQNNNSNTRRKPLYISALDAAKMLAVTPETVRNYVKSGVLDGRTIRANCRVLLSSIEQMASLDVTTLEHKKQALQQMMIETEAYRKDLETTRRTIERYAHSLEERYAENDVLRNIFRNRVQLAEVLSSLVSLMEEDRENQSASQVFGRVIAGEYYDGIARKMGLSRERVRQLFFKGARYIRQLSSYTKLMDDNKRLRTNLEEHVTNEKMLQAELSKLRQSIGNGRIKVINNQSVNVNMENMAIMVCSGFLSTKISDLYLSKRAINTLKATDAETVYDVILLTSEKILRVRNAGRKTLTEIEDVLETYELHLDMSKEDIYQWLLVEQAARTAMDDTESMDDGKEDVER